MEKSEKAKQLRALRKYGKKVRRRVCGLRMRPSIYQAGVPGSDLVLCRVCVFRLVLIISPQRGRLCLDINTIFP